MPSRRRSIQEDTHYRVLQILQAEPDLTQRELAERLGLSNGGIHYCLKALVEKGWLKVGSFAGSRNKLGYAYLLTPKGIARKAALTNQFLQRKLQEYELLKAEIERLRLEAGAGIRTNGL